MFFDFFSRFNTSKTVSQETHVEENSIEAFDELILHDQAVCLTDFTLFYDDNHCTLDLLLFFPHYGLYLGEKILWNAKELSKVSVKRYTRQSYATAQTQVEFKEKVIYQKLQDILSFDSTPLEQIFWMKNLTEAEFEALHPSFHHLLPKERLIFKNDTAADIKRKLHSLCEYQTEPFSQLKVIGSLNAHTLLLPTAVEAFGSFLSSEQQAFFNTPIKSRSTLLLCAPHSSGKSTVLIRKVVDHILKNAHQSTLIVTPTRLSGELLRNEFISIIEFAAVKCDLSKIHFYTPSPDNPFNEITRIFQECTLIVCDDAHLIATKNIEWLMEHKGSRSLLLSSVTNPFDLQTHTLTSVYRKPTIDTIHFSHTKGALFTLLNGLKIHLETISSNLIMIILPNHQILIQYKQAIEEHLHVQCRVLNDTFSLQYDDLEEITLSTPEHISGLNVPHSYLINMDNHDPLYYPLALSRASDTVTIITESNLEG
ncbi:MAG: DEAD/DEAH box helicase family protein [Sulfuricurvum sp.]|nr:DEAD/DEAH box helicase family protein [Sulfuricurvum sp.]